MLSNLAGGPAGVTSGAAPGVAAQPGCYVAAYISTCSMLALCIIVPGVHADRRSVGTASVCHRCKPLVCVASAHPGNWRGRTVMPNYIIIYVSMLLLA